MRIKAVIFDLDGTVIDSEENYYKADKLLMASFGINFTPEMKEGFIGTGNYEMMKRLKKDYGLDLEVQEMVDLKNQIYIEIARQNTNVYDGMIKFIDVLYENDMSMGLASGSSSGIIDELLDILDLKKYFKAIVSAEDVGKSKPEPDVFLEAAKRLNIEPKACVVVEDSKYGVEAAKRASMMCIAVPYLVREPLDASFMQADLLFEKGMCQFDHEKAYKWITSD